MARPLNEDTVETVRLTKDTVKKALADINGPKEKAKEHNGVAASATKTFCDDHGLDKQAVTKVCQLAKKEQDQQSLFWRSILEVAHLAGQFNGPDDQFDDHPVEIMRRIVAERDEKLARKAEREDGSDTPTKATLAAVQ